MLSLLCAAALSALSSVDASIGTEGLGNGFLGATHPFGMVQPGPDTVLEGMSVCNGYRFNHLGIYGFSQTHLNGTGCPAGGDVRILPFVGEDVAWDMRGFKDTAAERFEPGFYSVALTNFAVTVEATATKRVACYRFAFGVRRARVLVDLQYGLTQTAEHLHRHVIEAEAHLDADGRTLSGRNALDSWVSREYGFALRFNRPWTAVRTLARLPGEKADRYVFDFDLSPGEPLEARVALSSVDEAGALRNLAAEGAASFDDVRARTQAVWEELLSRVTLMGEEEDVRKIFYTSLYQLFVQPNEIADTDGRYRTGVIPRCGRPRGGIGVSPCADRSLYSSFSTWDTYRAAHPLYTILAPEMTEPFVASLMAQYRVNGFLPLVPFLGGETLCMIGNHTVPILCEAYFKERASGRSSGTDWNEVFDAVTNSLGRTHAGKIKEDWDLLDRYGYYPYDLVPREGVSRLLETAYDDSCAARFAAALGQDAAARRFAARAGLWTNVYDRTYGVVRGRDSSGRWREPFDEFQRAREWYPYDCTEADAWIYTFNVPQDVPGLIRTMGGTAAFLGKLDQFFVNPVSAVTGERRSRQYDRVAGDRDFGRYEHGNEPSHHIAWLYPYAGRPDRTAELVREIARSCYRATPDGMCGNADCGQLGAWYVFATLGFYPVDPVSCTYVLGAPLVPAAQVRVGGDGAERKTFSIRTKGLSETRKYVKSVTLNGRPHASMFLRHEDVMRGGELVFEMTDVPPGDELFGGDETVRWQAEIDRVAAAGGGRVTVPRGRHLVGQLDLRSNVELHLAAGSVLEGQVGLEHYRVTELPYSEGAWSAVVSAIGVTNVAVTGSGEIFGNGAAWPQPEGYGGNQEGRRARGLFFADCRDVRLADFRLRDAACWGVVFKRCDGVRVTGLSIDSHANLNNDGIDLEARNVVVANCRIDTGDDAVCIKSNDPGFAVENILVTNVTALSYCGSLKIGTATHGTIRNIRFVDCTAGCGVRDFRDRRPGRAGWWFGSTARTDTFPGATPGAARALSSIVVENVDGGVVEDVSFERIAVRDAYVPLFVRGGRRQGRACGTPPSDRRVFRNLRFRDISGTSASSVANSITGVEGCRVRDVRLENVRIVCPGGGETAAERTRPVPEHAGRYPEANMFDGQPLPAYGLYARHVDGLVCENVSFPLADGTYDQRPAVAYDDVTGAGAFADPKIWKVFVPPVGPGRYAVTLSARNPAFFVTPHLPGVKGHFSESGFTLLPGYPKTIVFTPEESLAPEAFEKGFKVESLRPTSPFPAARVKARLREVAESKDYYWAWTHTWTDPFEPGDRSMLADYTRHAGGRVAAIHYSDLAMVTGTWHSPAWYEARRRDLRTAIRQHWREHGTLAVFSWHMDQPYCTNGFPKAAYRFKSEGADRNVIRQILDGTGGPCGTDTLERRNAREPFANPRAWFMASLREVAAFFNSLDDGAGGKIPVVLRYGHECDGDWFWWGRTWCSAEEYKAFCRLTADSLREACGTNQILFAYTPDKTWTEFGHEGDAGNTFLAYYPGRDYVDLVGFDDYSIGQGDDATVAKSYEETLRKLRLVTDFARKNGQVAALTECGGRNKRDDFWVWVHRLMTADGVACAFVDTWRGPYGMLPDTSESAADELAFARRPEVLMEDSDKGFR